jgi:hypothetical protein
MKKHDIALDWWWAPVYWEWGIHDYMTSHGYRVIDLGPLQIEISKVGWKKRVEQNEEESEDTQAFEEWMESQNGTVIDENNRR